MTAARREIPPNEQLWALRHARDRYQALAEKLKDDPHFEGSAEEKRAQELEARRFASAYEKSVANMVASCRTRRVDLEGPAPGNMRVRFAILALLAAAMGGAAYFVLPHPDLPRIRIWFEPAGGARATNNEPERAAIPASASLPQAATLVPAATAPMEIAPVVRPRPRPAFIEPSAAPDPGGEFVAKVLQPDGSLREETFRARGPR